MRSRTRHFFPAVILALTVTILAASSCVKQESYPDTPEIAYESFALVFDTGEYATEGILTISYQDGDGNIGLASSDTFYPYNRNGDYYYNYVIRYFEKRDTGFVELPLDPPFSLRIPVLNKEYPGKPIKGIIVDTLTLDPTPDYDTIRLELFIYDRALNKSNVVTTPPIPLKRPD